MPALTVDKKAGVKIKTAVLKTGSPISDSHIPNSSKPAHQIIFHMYQKCVHGIEGRKTGSGHSSHSGQLFLMNKEDTLWPVVLEGFGQSHTIAIKLSSDSQTAISK